MDPGQITLAQAMEGYFIHAHARRLARGTLYNNTRTKFERFLGDDPPLSAITRSQIRTFLGSLHGLTAKSVLNHHVGLSALWTWAVKEGVVDRHIVRDITPPRPEQREVVPFTEEDVKAMLAACGRSARQERPGQVPCCHGRSLRFGTAPSSPSSSTPGTAPRSRATSSLTTST
jgi:site-specific recombinase XerD